MTFSLRYGLQKNALPWRLKSGLHGSAGSLIRRLTKAAADVIQGGLLAGGVENLFGTVKFHQVSDLA